MSASRLELKVGMFVIVLLGIAAVMTLRFSETGLGLSKRTPINLLAPSAGNVIPDAPIQLSGVKIGVVEDITLNTDGSGVIIHAGIFPKYWSVLDSNTTFEIRVTGLMGDEFIKAIPFQERVDRSKELKVRYENKKKNAKKELRKINERLIESEEKDEANERFLSELRKEAREELLKEAKENRKLLKPGQKMPCVAPFDLMAVARDTQQLIQKVGNAIEPLEGTIEEFRVTSKSINTFAGNLAIISTNVNLTVQEFHDAVSRVDTMVANNTNTLQVSLNNFAKFTGRLDASAGQLEDLIAKNEPMVSQLFTNLTDISASLKISTANLQATLATNRTNIDVIIKDVAAVTASLKSFTANADSILDDLEAGKGLAGGLLKDKAMRTEFIQMITELKDTVRSVKQLADQLTEKGLHYKPKPSAKPRPPPKSGRSR